MIFSISHPVFNVVWLLNLGRSSAEASNSSGNLPKMTIINFECKYLHPCHRCLCQKVFKCVTNLESMYVTPDIYGEEIKFFCSAAQPLGAQIEIFGAVAQPLVVEDYGVPKKSFS